MLDAKRLMDQFLGSQGPGGGLGRTAASGEGRAAPAGGFDLGGLAEMARGQLGGMGGMGGGALAGGLAGILMGSKKGRKLAGGALRMGGMAIVGALAYKAYRDWQAGQAAGQTVPAGGEVPMLPPPSDTPFNPGSEAGQQALGRKLLRAMIAAAKADGHVDAREQAAIFAELDRLDLDADDKAFVMDELRSALDVDAVAQDVSSQEEAAEIYAASLLAVDVDNAAERGYLAMLAGRLGLDDALVAHLHASVESVSEPVAVR